MRSLVSDMSETAQDDHTARYHALMAHCRRFHGADNAQAVFILIINLTLLFAGLAAMYALREISYVLALLAAVPTAFILVRVFIIQHDCGHGSYFSSRRMNDMTGQVISLLTLLPYTYWRREHDVHHAYVGQIERQDVGYIDIYTRADYQRLPAWRQWLYRIYRHPVMLLAVGVPLHNLVLMRIPPLRPSAFDQRRFLTFAQAWRSIMLHNLCLAIFYGTAGYLLGFGTLVAIYAPVAILGWQIGGWMFYVHHHFEDAYWQGGDDWHPHAARLLGSSQYDLPPLLHWLTGYIGLHHIHHFSSAVPHYKLSACNAHSRDLQSMNRISLRESFASIWLAIIDPAQRKMIKISDISP